MLRPSASDCACSTYTVTSNRFRLLVRDEGRNEIARSRQFIAGRTGQEYNQRKQRNGASCEDRDHATAVESAEHRARCLVYVDLDRLRAGVVSHPAQWNSGGYHQIQSPPARYRIIERAALAEALVPLCTSNTTHTQCIDTALRHGPGQRPCPWTASVAVGNREEFVARIETQLGHRAADPELQPFGTAYLPRDRKARCYGHVFQAKNIALSFKNTAFFEQRHCGTAP